MHWQDLQQKSVGERVVDGFLENVQTLMKEQVLNEHGQ